MPTFAVASGRLFSMLSLFPSPNMVEGLMAVAFQKECLIVRLS